MDKRVLEQKLTAYQRRLREFEATFKFDTPTFAKRFENGELGDDKARFAWDHARSAAVVLEKKLRDLETVYFECDNSEICRISNAESGEISKLETYEQIGFLYDKN